MSSKFARVAVVTLLSVCFLIGLSDEVKAEQAVAFITASKQGVIGGDETSKFGSGGIGIRAIGYGLTLPIDNATGQSAGVVRHSAMQLTKVPDRSSPKLITALATNENLPSVEIRFFRTASTGAIVHYHTFKLINARVSSFQTSGDTTASDGVIENVSFVYQKIEIHDVLNKTFTEAFWQSAAQ